MVFVKTRRTGRTYRILLRASIHLSEGNRVVLVARTKSYADELKKTLLDILPPSYAEEVHKRITTYGAEDFYNRELNIRRNTEDIFMDHSSRVI